MRRMDVTRKGPGAAAGGNGDEFAPVAYRAAMHWLRFAVLLLPLLVAGCGRVTDSEQLRLCRLVPPVLHPGGTVIREIRAAPDALGRSGVRGGFTAREPGAATRVRFVTCGFGGTTFERDRLDLVAVETHEGALGEARLLYLKRFLAQAEREGADTPSARQDLAQFPAAAAYALQQLVNAIALAAVYALLAT